MTLAWHWCRFGVANTIATLDPLALPRIVCPWQSERYWFWWHFQFVTNSCTFHSNIIWGWKSQILVTKLLFRILWIISKICVFPSTIYVLWKLLILVTNVVTRLDIFGTVTRSVTNVCNFYSNILKGVSYWYLLQLFINL